MKVPVKIADLRHRVTIETPVRTSDDMGGATLQWQVLSEVWVAIWSREVDERVSADRIAGRATHDIWMRYRGDVKPEMRIRLGTRLFNILGALDVDERAKWLKCPVEERDL